MFAHQKSFQNCRIQKLKKCRFCNSRGSALLIWVNFSHQKIRKFIKNQCSEPQNAVEWQCKFQIFFVLVGEHNFPYDIFEIMTDKT